MVCLLAARPWRRFGACEERRNDIYGSAQVLGRLIHHGSAAATLEIGPLMVPVIEPALSRVLVPAACGANRFATGSVTASGAAIAIAAIADGAQEEHLPAGRPLADDESERAHVARSRTRKLDDHRKTCDEGVSRHVPVERQ